jgi:hypothetical protein
MTSRSSLGMWFVSMALIAMGITLIAAVPEGRVPAGAMISDALPILPLPLSAAAVGGLIGWQRPGNRVGMLLSLLGLVTGLQFLAAGYSIFGSFSDHALPFADVAAWIFSWAGAAVGLCADLILFAFPERPLDLRSTRFGVACAVGGSMTFLIAIAIVPGRLFNIAWVQNPFGLAGSEPVIVALLVCTAVLFIATILLAVSSLKVRYRTADRRERLQLKWFFAGLVFAFVGAIVSVPFGLVDFAIAKIGVTLAVSAIPIAIAIAILREHLYDIDVVINRALVYGATTAGIAVAFFAGIVVLQTILRPFTNGSDIAVAASTLASVAIAQPLRRRMQDAVDQRFYRSRYDAVRTLDAFSVRLRDEVDLDAVRGELVAAVRDTVQPVHTSVWLREGAR